MIKIKFIFIISTFFLISVTPLVGQATYNEVMRETNDTYTNYYNLENSITKAKHARVELLNKIEFLEKRIPEYDTISGIKSVKRFYMNNLDSEDFVNYAFEKKHIYPGKYAPKPIKRFPYDKVDYRIVQEYDLYATTYRATLHFTNKKKNLYICIPVILVDTATVLKYVSGRENKLIVDSLTSILTMRKVELNKLDLDIKNKQTSVDSLNIRYNDLVSIAENLKIKELKISLVKKYGNSKGNYYYNKALYLNKVYEKGLEKTVKLIIKYGYANTLKIYRSSINIGNSGDLLRELDNVSLVRTSYSKYCSISIYKHNHTYYHLKNDVVYFISSAYFY